MVYYSVIRVTRPTGNPPYSILPYSSSLQGGEWLKRGGQRTPAAPYPVGLIRAGTKRAWICWSGSAARCPAAQARMLAGAGALSGCITSPGMPLENISFYTARATRPAPGLDPPRALLMSHRAPLTCPGCRSSLKGAAPAAAWGGAARSRRGIASLNSRRPVFFGFYQRPIESAGGSDLLTDPV